ncbi:MAG: TetR/AcrR family transcriptional regulator [bacterium]|nr:TetR/AcrR family transcriptional regulator [bacterium]
MDGKQEVDSPIPRDLRVSPRQARARETVGRILDTAAALLDEVGVDGFNTNLLATRAGVRVRTIYRYFPNKSAVILALAKRVVSEWDAWAESELAKLDAAGDWRTAVEHATRGLFQRVREIPGHAAIRRAMRAVPELYLLDQQDNVRLAGAFAHALRQVEPELAPARASRIARCLIESSVAIVDVALEQPTATARGLIDELVEMQLAYLESILA